MNYTTLRDGDFSPQTDLGKTVTIFYVLTSIGIIFGFINAFYQRHSIDSEIKLFITKKKD
jgi:hypothetical protein